jgi:hypothetical protein
MGDFIYTSTSLVFGAFSVIFAIALWARTREGAWLFIILGIISLYIEKIYSILSRFGILEDFALIDTVPALTILFGILPSIFFIIAFLMMIIKSA